jgi:hypothetical protein
MAKGISDILFVLVGFSWGGIFAFDIYVWFFLFSPTNAKKHAYVPCQLASSFASWWDFSAIHPFVLAFSRRFNVCTPNSIISGKFFMGLKNEKDEFSCYECL